jgi:opacity protein-like surface antigen
VKYLITICLILTSFTISHAQYREGHMWVISSGVTFPMSPDSFSDRWKSGYHLEGGILYSLNLEQRIMIKATASYQKLTPNTNSFLTDLGISNPNNRINLQSGSGSIWSLACNLKITPRWTEGFLIPYALGGPSLMRVHQDVTYISQGATQSQQFKQTTTDIGLSLGVGIDFDLPNTITLFFESQYTMVFTQEAGPRFIPIRLGILF